jgi:hypothetical protein
LSCPLTEPQCRNLERTLLAVDVRSHQVARLVVVAEGTGRAAAMAVALELGQAALVDVGAWFDRVDVFDARRQDDRPSGSVVRHQWRRPR